MHRRVLACLLVLAAAPTRSALAQTPLFQSDIRAATSPTFGFEGTVDDCDNTTNCTWERLAGAAPSGADAIRITLLPGGVNGQAEIQWFTTADTLPAVTQGQPLYVRYRIRVQSSPYWPSDFNGTNANSSGGKMFILGNGCGSDGRMIATIAAPSLSRDDPTYLIDENVNGTQAFAAVTNFDAWDSIQYRFRSSSTSSATDGGFDIYVNNNNVNAPDDSTDGVSLPTTNWGGPAASACGFAWGFTPFNALAVGGSFRVDIADFEIDDEFDDTWASGGDPPSTPATFVSRPRLAAAARHTAPARDVEEAPARAQ